MSGGARLGRLLSAWELEGARAEGPTWCALVDLLREGLREEIAEAVSLILAYPLLSVALREALGTGPELAGYEVGVLELEARAWRVWWLVYVHAYARGGAR